MGGQLEAVGVGVGRACLGCEGWSQHPGLVASDRRLCVWRHCTPCATPGLGCQEVLPPAQADPRLEPSGSCLRHSTGNVGNGMGWTPFLCSHGPPKPGPEGEGPPLLPVRPGFWPRGKGQAPAVPLHALAAGPGIRGRPLLHADGLARGAGPYGPHLPWCEGQAPSVCPSVCPPSILATGPGVGGGRQAGRTHLNLVLDSARKVLDDKRGLHDRGAQEVLVVLMLLLELGQQGLACGVGEAGRQVETQRPPVRWEAEGGLLASRWGQCEVGVGSVGRGTERDMVGPAGRRVSVAHSTRAVSWGARGWARC